MTPDNIEALMTLADKYGTEEFTEWLKSWAGEQKAHWKILNVALKEGWAHVIDVNVEYMTDPANKSVLKRDWIRHIRDPLARRMLQSICRNSMSGYMPGWVGSVKPK